MKKKALAITVIALAAVLGISALLYPKLQKRYEASAPSPEAKPTAEQPVQTAAQPAQTAEQSVQNEAAEETVPDFTVLDMDGNAVSLSAHFGKPIVLNFWATWCGPCRSELSAFDSAYAVYGDAVTFLMVDLTDGVRETVEETKRFAEENGYTFPIYFDTEYSAAYTYGVRSIPMTVFVNADGTLSDVRIGALSEAVLNGYLEEMTGK